jgi:hypothetical protein
MAAAAKPAAGAGEAAAAGEATEEADFESIDKLEVRTLRRDTVADADPLTSRILVLALTCM